MPRFHVEEQDHNLGHTLDRKLIERCQPAIEKGRRVQIMEVARNVNRTVGAMLSGAVTAPTPMACPMTPSASVRRHGRAVVWRILCNGITLSLIGDANDYAAKDTIRRPHRGAPQLDFRGEAVRNTIVEQHRDVRRHQRRGFLQRRGR